MITYNVKSTTILIEKNGAESTSLEHHIYLWISQIYIWVSSGFLMDWRIISSIWRKLDTDHHAPNSQLAVLLTFGTTNRVNILSACLAYRDVLYCNCISFISSRSFTKCTASASYQPRMSQPPGLQSRISLKTCLLFQYIPMAIW